MDAPASLNLTRRDILPKLTATLTKPGSKTFGGLPSEEVDFSENNCN
jgi:hypothetical protein